MCQNFPPPLFLEKLESRCLHRLFAICTLQYIHIDIKIEKNINLIKLFNLINIFILNFNIDYYYFVANGWQTNDANGVIFDIL